MHISKFKSKIQRKYLIIANEGFTAKYTADWDDAAGCLTPVLPEKAYGMGSFFGSNAHTLPSLNVLGISNRLN